MRNENRGPFSIIKWKKKQIKDEVREGAVDTGNQKTEKEGRQKKRKQNIEEKALLNSEINIIPSKYVGRTTGVWISELDMPS